MRPPRGKLQAAGLDLDAMLRDWQRTRSQWLRSGRPWHQFEKEHRPEDVLTEEQASALLTMELDEAVDIARGSVGNFDQLDRGPKMALVDMALNLGPGGLWKFRRMRQEVERGNWWRAAAEMRNSRWAKQVGPRRVQDDARCMVSAPQPRR